MDRTDQAMRITYELLDDARAAVDAGADPLVQALAHLGAAILLFAEIDGDLAERLAAVIEGQPSALSRRRSHRLGEYRRFPAI